MRPRQQAKVPEDIRLGDHRGPRVFLNEPLPTRRPFRLPSRRVHQPVDEVSGGAYSELAPDAKGGEPWGEALLRPPDAIRRERRPVQPETRNPRKCSGMFCPQGPGLSPRTEGQQPHFNEPTRLEARQLLSIPAPPLDG